MLVFPEGRITETETDFISVGDSGGETDRGPETDSPRRDRRLDAKLIVLSRGGWGRGGREGERVLLSEKPGRNGKTERAGKGLNATRTLCKFGGQRSCGCDARLKGFPLALNRLRNMSKLKYFH